MPEPGYTVLTRDVSGNAAWRGKFERRGLRVYELPCIRTVPSDLTPQLRQTFGRLAEFDWVVFTSAAGVRHFTALAAQLQLSPRAALDGVPLAAVGRQTARRLESLGLAVSFTPSRPNAATLARKLEPVKNRRILLVHTSIAPPGPARILEGRSAAVTSLPVYHTIPVTDPDDVFEKLLTEAKISQIVFASPSAVAGFRRRLSPPSLEAARGLPALALGPSATAALTEAGFSDVRTAAVPTSQAILNLI